MHEIEAAAQLKEIQWDKVPFPKSYIDYEIDRSVVVPMMDLLDNLPLFPNYFEQVDLFLQAITVEQVPWERFANNLVALLHFSDRSLIVQVAAEDFVTRNSEFSRRWSVWLQSLPETPQASDPNVDFVS